jgi:hypothetical protein
VLQEGRSVRREEGLIVDRSKCHCGAVESRYDMSSLGSSQKTPYLSLMCVNQVQLFIVEQRRLSSRILLAQCSCFHIWQVQGRNRTFIQIFFSFNLNLMMPPSLGTVSSDPFEGIICIVDYTLMRIVETYTTIFFVFFFRLCTCVPLMYSIWSCVLTTI